MVPILLVDRDDKSLRAMNKTGITANRFFSEVAYSNAAREVPDHLVLAHFLPIAGKQQDVNLQSAHSLSMLLGLIIASGLIYAHLWGTKTKPLTSKGDPKQCQRHGL